MSTYTATIEWALDGEFARGRYSRAHAIRFDGGIEVRGSSSPSVVPLPWSAEAAVDPEEMLVAALSSCHMLSFLDIARRAGWSIDRYSEGGPRPPPPPTTSKPCTTRRTPSASSPIR